MARPIVTTTGADSPFFSPDGAWIGYVDAGELRQRIVEVGENENARALPHILPGSQWMLLTVQPTAFRWDDAKIVARSLVNGQEKVLLTDATDARYVSSGHLVFLRRGKLMAVAFDVDGVALAGAPVAVVDDVMQAIHMPNSLGDSGAGQFAVAESGTLVYVTGGPLPSQPGELVWIDRAGNVEPVGAPRGPFGAPRVSPDGRRIAMFSGAAATDGHRIWIYDIERRTYTALTTRDEHVAWAVWSPDGNRIVFARLHEGKGTLHVRAADGSGRAEPIVEARSTYQTPSSWARTGNLAFVESVEGNSTDIRVLDTNGSDRSGAVAVQTPEADSHPAFSPDGLWLAYTSGVSGRSEVYVQPYPAPGPRVLISTNGGAAPAWRGDGRELYYQFVQDDALRLMAVPIMINGAVLSAGTPRQLFEVKGLSSTAPSRGYDVTPDGQRFLFQRAVEVPPPPATPMVLVENWIEELKRLAPASR